MDFKFIHAADLHIDSPMKGLNKYEGAPIEQIKVATRKAFENLIDLCLIEEVKFLLLAGDVFDGDLQDANARLFFNHQIKRLTEKHIKVFIIRGNHDAASVITKQIKLPEGVVEFFTDKVGTEFIEELQVAIHGISFESRSETRNLALEYPLGEKGYFNIGMLHTSLTGREEHENYAPCREQDLISKGYDYWALGHIHKRQVVQTQDPAIVYPGNIQGRNIKETGEKGCFLVTVKGGKITELNFRSLDVLRWNICEINLDKVTDRNVLYDKAKTALEEEIDKCNEKSLIVRIVLKGRTELHNELEKNLPFLLNEIRNIGNQVAYGQICVEKIKIDTEKITSVEELVKRNPVIHDIFQMMDLLKEEEETIKDIADTLGDLKTKLPPDYFQLEQGVAFDSQQYIHSLIDEVKEDILFEIQAKVGEIDEI
ncbi:MAG: DNA repair exonuclease [Clostridiaceae bacterium]|nr:DNA repair exonuclease [Clostridiaceae bacterium]